jgi:hypothetical protein
VQGTSRAIVNADQFNVMHDKPPMNSRSKIIAAGLFSLRTKQYEETRNRLLTAARLRFAKELKDASFLGRRRLKLKIEREVQAELDKLYPPGALYAVPQRHTRA